ncbi:MAG: hypothetical protein ACO4CG_11415 [Prochlorothrix sp.]|nr:hypothetical protein [Prochlorothrix sp.]
MVESSGSDGRESDGKATDPWFEVERDRQVPHAWRNARTGRVPGNTVH